VYVLIVTLFKIAKKWKYPKVHHLTVYVTVTQKGTRK
jgi:hypothetical protein